MEDDFEETAQINNRGKKNTRKNKKGKNADAGQDDDEKVKN